MRGRPVVGVILILVGVLGLWFLGSWSGPGGPGWDSPGSWGGWAMGRGMMGPMMGGPIQKRAFASAGEQIYYTGVSSRSGPIPFTGGPPWVWMQGGGCASCHGIRGQGGVPVMMGTEIPADIRYGALTAKEHRAEAEGHEEHPAYTDELIRRAITEGLDPAGKPLDWTMPRWRMGKEDLDDLLAFLKTLK